MFDSIQWGSDSTALYADNDETGSLDFYAMTVNSEGISSVNDYDSAFISNERRIHFDRGTGLIYSDNGQVIDPSTGNTIGQFPGPDGAPVYGMVPDSAINTAFFLFDGITSFNLTDLSMINSIFPGSTGGFFSTTAQSSSGADTSLGPPPARIIRWGNNGLAYKGSIEGPVFIVGGGFVH